LLIQCAPDGYGPSARHLAERLQSLTFVASRDPVRFDRPFVRYDVNKPEPAEQRRLWQQALGPRAAALNGTLDDLSQQFKLSARMISSTGSLMASNKDQIAADELWNACRSLARPKLEDLAQRIVPATGWDDLVLPEAQLQTLRQLTEQVRHRMTVHESWGFSAKGRRGLGVSALFTGESGTGKTLAAEVLAHELALDLYRIDLASVVSKYIGETEKNLRQVFDAAEEGGVLLLFDEADALFGKRSEVRDSHDRYANIEVGYLLQRMEAYAGLAILTTNLKSSLDKSFQRRLRFTVNFPFPDVKQREAMWARVFPHSTPTTALDAKKLAQLNVTGGNIRNIALNAAFLAASSTGSVDMAHVLQAARLEAYKIERPLSDAETRGWV
jgi:SpoVK/Ycf46/Vps4 family AAA+-type ATPase